MGMSTVFGASSGGTTSFSSSFSSSSGGSGIVSQSKSTTITMDNQGRRIQKTTTRITKSDGSVTETTEEKVIDGTSSRIGHSSSQLSHKGRNHYDMW